MKQLHPRAVWLFFLSLFLPFFIIFLYLGFNLIFVILGIFLESRISLESNKNIEIINYTRDNLSGILITIFIAIIIAIILVYILAKLTYHFYRYELKKDGFYKEQGVIIKKYIVIPYDRIQNVDIYRGILARILRLSDLHIQTAGTSRIISLFSIFGVSAAEGRLPGLSIKDAEQLRDELISRAKQSKNQGL